MSKTKILYVDDEPINLMLFKLSLSKNHAVITAENGEKGLEILSTTPDVDVVFSDMRMPIMDGLEFITEAKKLLPAIPYYILSGFDLNAEIQNALDNKLIKKYFQKPFDLNAISSEIEQSMKPN